ncbi:hypothetical protein LPJ54_001473, partial [Coemansia sp. RSA 1824]
LKKSKVFIVNILVAFCGYLAHAVALVIQKAQDCLYTLLGDQLVQPHPTAGSNQMLLRPGSELFALRADYLCTSCGVGFDDYNDYLAHNVQHGAPVKK